MKSSEIRRRFLDFFEERDHRVQPSADLLTSDPDLLFNIAGMVPFKPYFLDREDPPAPRLTTAQKCIRTEDIEQVGETARHQTFFEMLGNFSFGDYFKDDAIRYGWDFLVEEMDLDPDRLWITVFGGDDELDPDVEAEELWRSLDGVPEERILRLGREENFWAMGATGPCGPCSEILYDQESADEDPEAVKRMILDGKDRILELWNLVFMEFERPEEGAELRPLPQKNIDTGLGLERLAAVKQNADSNFGTDLFVPLMDDVRDLTGRDLTSGTDEARARVIADHLRASAFLLAEGLLPGNEGRGYVLRRLIRRAHLRGRRMGLEEPFLSELVPTLIDLMGDHFEELPGNRRKIVDQLDGEEEQFERILDQGLDELDDRIAELRNEERSTFPGRRIFDLYETHGLPVDMTTEVLDEEEIDYDEAEIEEARREHEEQSRDESGEEDTADFDFEDVPRTEFTGYEELERETEIVGLFQGAEEKMVDSLEISPTPTAESGEEFKANDKIILDATPFYAEGGGQSGDRGWIGQNVKVQNTTEIEGRHVHSVRLKRDSTATSVDLRIGDTVQVKVDRDFRLGNMRHHTATHLLHAALRKKLGDQVMQDGSSLDDEGLRFDFTYGEAVPDEKLEAVERRVNEWIDRALPLRTEVMNREEAEQRGALAFFGEHYGQEVRVVTIGEEGEDPVSMEFCGGTHLDHTGEVGVFAITNETAVAAGVRRIEAVAGGSAYEELRTKRELLREAAGTAGLQQVTRLADRVDELQGTIDELEEEREQLRRKESSSRAAELTEQAETVGGCSVVAEVVETADSDVLKTLVDEVRNRLDSGLVLLVGKTEDNVQLILATSGEAGDSVDAGDWIRELGGIVGGGGGGRPDFAEAGGSDPDSVGDAVERFHERVREEFAETARN